MIIKFSFKRKITAHPAQLVNISELETKFIKDILSFEADNAG